VESPAPALEALGHDLDLAVAHQPGRSWPAALAAADRIADTPVFVAGYYKTGTSALLGRLEGHPALWCCLSIEIFFRSTSRRMKSCRRMYRRASARCVVEPVDQTGGKPPSGRWDTRSPANPTLMKHSPAPGVFAARRTPADPLAAVAQAMPSCASTRGTWTRGAALLGRENTHTETGSTWCGGLPAARFIHILRDPRSRLPRSAHGPAARPDDFHWSRPSPRSRSHSTARDNQQRLGVDRYHVLRYEDLSQMRSMSCRRGGVFGHRWDAVLLTPSVAGHR
jgi:hypothetical protein